MAKGKILISDKNQKKIDLIAKFCESEGIEYAFLESDEKDTARSTNLFGIDMSKIQSEIKEITIAIRTSVDKELKKLGETNAEYTGYPQKEIKIEKILKKIYLANDVTDIFDIIYDIKNIAQSEGITIYILDENEKLGKHLHPIAWDETFLTHEEFIHNIGLTGSEDFAASVACSGEEINIAEISSEESLPERYTEQTKSPLKNLLCIPIKHEREVIGVLEVYNKMSNGEIDKGGFPKEDQETLRVLAEHISIAMTKLNFIQYDALTGLLRREAFYKKVIQKINSNIKRRKEEGLYAMVIGDVDWFKNYNDRNGHEAGNVLLRELAKVLKSSVREEDLLCRYGGEEFLFFLVGNKDIEDACRLTERIRKNVEEHDFKYQEFQPRNNLTMSFGLTLFPREKTKIPFQITKDELPEIINEADMAMAEAKGKKFSSLIPQQNDLVKNKVCAYYRNQGDKETPTIKQFQETSFHDKRKFTRFNVSSVLIYRENGSLKLTKTVNLSLEGVRIISESELPEAQTLDLVLILGKNAISSKAEVVYAESVSEESSYFSGLKFKDFSLSNIKVLIGYLYHSV
jgi:diguanylate cyclase (GGDEF)-like protein